VEHIGPYEVLEPIARGGMGMVLRARDARRDRDVAIKLHLDRRPRIATRFEREIKALIRLRHPNIVRILDAGSHEAQPYLVMELVPGDNLDRRVKRRGALPPADALAMALALARALAHAHAHGVLHRDLKPANVLLRSAGDGAPPDPLLTDFGLTRDVDAERDGLSVTGSYIGTPGFWPPEQAVGDRSRIGPASDVYGLGALLYFMLTGRAPYPAQTPHEAIEQLREPVSPPSTHVPALRRRPDVEDLVLDCLAPAPAARPSIDEVAARLAELRARASPQARRTSARAAIALAGAAGVLGLVALALAAGRFADDGPPPPRPTAPESAASPEPAEPAEPAVPSGVRATLADARAAAAAGELDAALEGYAAALDGLPDEVPSRAAAAAEAAELHLARAARRCADGRRKAAIPDAERALALAPETALPAELCGDLADAYLARARSFLDRQDADSARADLDRALELRPGDAAALAARGDAAYGVDDLERAARDYTAALAADPDVAIDPVWLIRALCGRARLACAREDWPTALAAAERALAADPHHNPGIYYRARALAGLERPAEAARAFGRYLDAFPEHMPSLIGKAECHLAAGEVEPARATVARALALPVGPYRPAVLLVRGRVRAASGATEDAVADLTAARDLLDADDERREEIARLLAELERGD